MHEGVAQPDAPLGVRLRVARPRIAMSIATWPIEESWLAWSDQHISRISAPP